MTREPPSFASFAERLERIVGADARAAWTAAAAAPRAISIRLNPLRGPVAETAAALAASGFALEPQPWCAEACVVRGGPTTTGDAPPRHDDDADRPTDRALVAALQTLPAHAAGAFHIQSLSSIAAGLALAPEPGERVLDLCAAPGSKTSHLAALMANRGELVANDRSRDRSFKLRAVLAQLGAEARVVVGPGDRFGRREPDAYDRVLVDAPCSGEGRIRPDDPASWADWSPRKIRRLASEQKSLLHAAIIATRPGGGIVYSTCTFAPEENELVLARALERYGDRVALAPLPFEPPSSVPALRDWDGAALPTSIAEHARRIVPGLAPRLPMEGFFVARLVRTSG